ncbi:hypothetical protein C3L33_08277, partial [Rhododendron williamsianum]
MVKFLIEIVLESRIRGIHGGKENMNSENQVYSFMLTPKTIFCLVFYLVILAENGRLREMEIIAKRFTEVTMAHRGEVKAFVTTVIPLPAEEEKELKETLQEILGQGKKVKLEQKIDSTILGGLVVEFSQKVFDMSIKTRAKQMERFLRDPVNLGI